VGDRETLFSMKELAAPLDEAIGSMKKKC